MKLTENMGTWLKRSKTKYVINHEVESMDHILEGVLASNHPDLLKRELIQKISEKGQEQQPASDIRAVLQLATSWVLNGSTELQVSSGFKLFSSWAKYNIVVLESFFTRDLLVSLLSKPCQNQANLPLLLTETLSLLQSSSNAKIFQQHLKIIEAKSAAFVQENSEITCVKNYLDILIKFQDNVSNGDLASRLAVPLLRVLASNPIPPNQMHVCHFIKDVTAVSDFLNRLWSLESTLTSVLVDCLREIFHIISAVEGPEPSVCLGAVVRYIPVGVVQEAVKAVVADSSVEDICVNTALCRMIDWLVWPTCKNIDQWVICFLKELAATKKFSILISVTERKVEQVVEKLQFPPVREASFNILSHMLLSFQHTPEPFHKVLELIPATLEALNREKTESSHYWRCQIAKLLHCLMFLHTGFPDLYDSILDLIKDIQPPDPGEIQSHLVENRWNAQACSSDMHDLYALMEKSDTGKTGLFNLGNTCYMNCILQTLFMCDEFRQQVLLHKLSPEEDLLDKLCHVFASLLLSRRPAIAPTKFLSASRPPWFVPGQQQDCSEFLKYLLDQIHEQQVAAIERCSRVSNNSPASRILSSSDKSTSSSSRVKISSDESQEQLLNNKVTNCCATFGTNSKDDQNEKNGKRQARECELESSVDATIVREAFGGKVRTTLRCLTCKQESHRVEGFIDIPLAFPQTGSGASSPISSKSLVGGGSNVQKEEPMEHDAGVAVRGKENNSDDLPEPIHLSKLLSHYLSTERLEGDNKYHCDHCGQLQDGERTIAIIQSPQYLILTLLRFAFDTVLQTRSKVFKEVVYPRTIALPVQQESMDVSLQTTRRRKKLLSHLHPQLPTTTSPISENYDLYGLCSVVIHSGASSECGHYYCYCRHSQVGNIDSVINSLDKTAETRSRVNGAVAWSSEEADFLQDRWFMFNDCRVSYTKYSSFSKVSQRFQKDTPYMLVYKKIDLDAQEQRQNVDLQLPQDLRDAVNLDNIEYLKEQENAAKSRASRPRSESTSSLTFSWHDNDSDQGPPGSCGGGGLGGFDVSGSRFIF